MKKILLILALLALGLTLTLWLRYGGGEPYPDLTSGPPLVDEQRLETVLAYPEPIGSVAVSAEGRVFFTVHPEARPRGNRLLEYVDGAAEPYPDGASQQRLFDTVLGLVIDDYDRLWTIDHGNHGLRDARLVGIDLATGDVVHERRFDSAVAAAGSLLQDLEVSADGRTIVIADTSVWRKRPALIVYDLATAAARRVLEGHESVTAGDFVIRTRGREMSFLGGILTLKGGVDGMALDGDWLYYGALTGAGLYRVALHDLTNPELPPAQLAARVERVADKPLSDGLSIDTAGLVYGTDVEHGTIFRVAPGEGVTTVLRSGRLRWPDALSFGPDGWLYVADSALGDVILAPREAILERGPYHVYRFQPGTAGPPGR
ncbi:MAG: L-dopachrome tautomerase-related protein [Woeseiaceae bacterium]|nr:L-dopachrome tautomerase-related protein [Woeseiaceae bacterium]